MDGLNFFNQVNFLYNRSSNFLKLIGFHNDFTTGIISKTYRMKELGLYILDDNNYYSSKTNTYLYYSNEVMPKNTTELSTLLSSLVYISNILNRTFIFPRFICGKVKCTFVRIYNLEHFEKYCGTNYRENSFLFSSKIPSNLVNKSIKIDIIKSDSDINNLYNIKTSLMIIKNIDYSNKQHINCFISDDYWQKKFK